MTEEDIQNVLFGRRPPRTAEERSYLRFMGGIQDEPPLKRIACRKCNSPFEAAGFPFPNGKPFYPIYCPECRSWLAKAAPKRKTQGRTPYKD